MQMSVCRINSVLTRASGLSSDACHQVWLRPERRRCYFVLQNQDDPIQGPEKRGD